MQAALRQRFYDAANTKQYNSTVAALTNTQAQVNTGSMAVPSSQVAVYKQHMLLFRLLQPPPVSRTCSIVMLQLSTLPRLVTAMALSLLWWRVCHNVHSRVDCPLHCPFMQD